MDPTVAVKRIRQLILAAEEQEGLTPEGVSELIELWNGLDRWMSKGGFLPKQWEGSGRR